MEFQFNSYSSYYYVFYDPLPNSIYLSAKTVNFGSFVTSFLSLNLEKLEKELFECENSLPSDYQDFIIQVKNYSNSKYYSAIKKVLDSNCELPYLSTLLHEDLEACYYSYELSIAQAFEAKKNTFQDIQNELRYNILNGHFRENSTFNELITEGVQNKIEVTFSRPSDIGNGDSGICMTYSLHDTISMIALDWINVCDLGFPIKQCSNCERFFIPSKRSDEIYCNRIYKNGKTCKELGYSLKIADDPFKAIFTKARKTQHARIRYNKHIKDYKEKHYEPWLQAATQARDEYKSANNIEGFENWIEEHKNAF